MKKDKDSDGVFTDKKIGIMYSLFLGLGVVSLFVFVNAAYAFIEGAAWSYSTSYLVDVGLLALMSFFAGVLCILSCRAMIHTKRWSIHTGTIACVLLLCAPVMSYVYNGGVSNAFNISLMAVVPAIVILIGSIIFWYKSAE